MTLREVIFPNFKLYINNYGLFHPSEIKPQGKERRECTKEEETIFDRDAFARRLKEKADHKMNLLLPDCRRNK